MNNVVVFSPSRFSLYTIAVTELLLRHDVQVSAIIVRRLVNPSRFVTEFTRDGSRLLRKIWKKLVLRKRAYSSKECETIVDLLRAENIHQKTVDEFHGRYNIPVIYCNSLNDPLVVEKLREADPDLVVSTGGGLIRKDALENSGAGILNCHMGLLPEYRGMDVVEWPILEDKPRQIGITVHFMDQGVDTGDILRVTKLALEPGEDIKMLRDRFGPFMCRQMVATCVDYLAGTLERKPQTPEEGKQFYIMHRRLIRIAESKLNRYEPSSA